MQMRFTKMHGLGNDFIVVRGSEIEPPSRKRIRQLADRRTGIGFDQLLWLERPRDSTANVAYRIFNRDGTEAEQCGNGARCIARLIAPEHAGELLLEHRGGLSRARVESNGSVTVEMGVPRFEPASIPFRADSQQQSYRLDVDGETIELRVVSIGNPHGVLEVDDIESAPVERLGPLLESHDRFPNRANIGFMQVVTPDQVRLRVFERGAGETLGCGTGACAAAVVGRRAGRLNERVTVELPGGSVTVSWKGPGAPAWLTGEAVTVFEGTVQV